MIDNVAHLYRSALLAIALLAPFGVACDPLSASQNGSSEGTLLGTGQMEAVGPSGDEASLPMSALTMDTARIALDSATYKTTFTIDEDVKEVITHRSLLRVGGARDGILRLREVTGGTPSGAEILTDLAADTLRPVRRVIEQPNASAEIDYGNHSVTGQVRMGEREIPVRVDLEAPAFGEGAALEAAILALPLADGYTTPLRSVETGLLQRVRTWSLVVAGREAVDVPAGSFATFRIDLQPVDEMGGRKTLWVTQATPRRLVKLENRLPPQLGGTVTTTSLIKTQ